MVHSFRVEGFLPGMKEPRCKKGFGFIGLRDYRYLEVQGGLVSWVDNPYNQYNNPSYPNY